MREHLPSVIASQARSSSNFRGFAVAASTVALVAALAAGHFSPRVAALEEQPITRIANPTMPASFADVVEAVRPAVVSIAVKGHSRVNGYSNVPNFHIPVMKCTGREYTEKYLYPENAHRRGLEFHPQPSSPQRLRRPSSRRSWL